MKKLTLADKLARKSFESDKFQQNWQAHYQAFGPILEPAFVDNYQAKIHLTAALNFISNRNFAKAGPKLKELEKYVETEEDKAAYLFFAGLYYEMMGNIPQAVELYDYANEYVHNFYLPYMKSARFHQQALEYDSALTGYDSVIESFDTNLPLTAQEKQILASAYTNRATCLTMMHRYDEALESMERAQALGVSLPDSASVEAILYAALGKEEKALHCLEQLKSASPAVFEKIRETVETILNRTNPAFFPVDMDDAKIEAFWVWFADYSDELKERLDLKQYEEAMAPVPKKLLETFPFLEEEPIVSLGQNEKGYVLELRDMYYAAVIVAFDKLLSVCPAKVMENWQFVVVH